MLKSIICVDDFYIDAPKVREVALNSHFDVLGNYPGRRTGPFLNNEMRQAIESLVQRPITFWPEDTYNGAFQITTSADRSWIHSDHTTNYAGVLYLTPNAPLSSGTAFYRHNPTGHCYYPNEIADQHVCEQDAALVDRWSLTDYIANVFNRLVLFDSRRFHCSTGYFGSGLDDGRLFQTFFFTVEM